MAFYQIFVSAPRCVGRFLGKNDNPLTPVRTCLVVFGGAGVICTAIFGRLAVLKCGVFVVFGAD